MLVVYSLAFVADVFAQTLRLQFGVAFMAEGATTALDEAQIGQFDVALFAPETTRMPILVHRLDHPTDDEFAALSAARREQYLEIVLAVLTSLEFEESSIFEDLEALSAPKYRKTNYFFPGLDWLCILRACKGIITIFKL